MEPVYKGHEFESLKLRYEDQVVLLRALTALDIKIFTGFITIQFILGGWISTQPIDSLSIKVGLLLIDIVLAGIAGKLLYNQYIRRKEAIETVKNLNEALGYTQKGIYLNNKAINPEGRTRPWIEWYIIGIVVGVIGFVLILF